MLRILSIPLLTVLLIACGTDSNGISVSTPAGLKICTDYMARYTCHGEPYFIVNDAGRTVRRHDGIDFSADVGDLVIAPAHGYVVFIGVSECGGGFVTIRMPGIWTNPQSGRTALLYTSVNHIVPSEEISRGDTVSPGQVIGTVAPKGQFSGRCWGSPHVHFEVSHESYRDKNDVNPHVFWLDGDGQVTCWHEGLAVPDNKVVAPLLCER